jgi:hypothetical protein
MAAPTRIDATGIIDVRLSHDGQRVHLRLRDTAGQVTALSLPAACLNAVFAVLPRRVEPGSVHPLDSWSMAPTPNGQQLLLTLCTPEGQSVAFTTTPWQVQGMATIATYGHRGEITRKSIH